MPSVLSFSTRETKALDSPSSAAIFFCSPYGSLSLRSYLVSGMVPLNGEDVINSLYLQSLYPTGLTVKRQILEHSVKTFGERLKLARETAGLSQERLAELLGVDQVQVSKWERGSTQPRMERLQPIGAAVGFLDWLLTGEGKGPVRARKTGLPMEEESVERPLRTTQPKRKRA